MEQQSLSMDDCIEKVIKYYSDMVYRLAFARSKNKYDAEEIFQEVFLRYVKNQTVFKEEEHREAWLIRATINCSKNLWNSPWKRKTEPLDDNIIFEAFKTETDIVLYKELQKLPSKYREVIHLFYYEDMRHKIVYDDIEISTDVDGIELTGIGYIDGKLHIQTAVKEVLNNDNHGFLYLKYKDKNVIDCNYNFYFFNQYEQSNQIQYCEYVFDIPQDKISKYTLYGDFVTSKMKTEGNWKVTFPLEKSTK